jgi:rhodanese-related sulfurtransferase
LRKVFISAGTLTAPIATLVLIKHLYNSKLGVIMKSKMAIGSALLALAIGSASPVLLAQTAGAEPQPAAAGAYTYKWKTPKLNRAQIDELLAKPEKLLIIDVRRPDEVEKIGGFPVYFSVQTSDLEKNLAYIPKDRSIVTVSNHAGRAGQIADALSGKGFKVVGAIGVQNYEEEGGKISKTRSYYQLPTAQN